MKNIQREREWKKDKMEREKGKEKEKGE